MAVSDSPGVHVPPPFFFVTAIGAGLLLHRAVPLPIGGGTPRIILAWACVAAFAGLLVAAVTSFWRRRTTVIPNRPANTLVVAGPYRFTRNPMYVAMTLLTTALGLWMNTWWIVLLLIPTLVVIDRYVIAHEEAYLRRRFGADYEAYLDRVPRWLGRPSPRR
jgi:protein-S-isoprenylcysteine O-methyltransferase Ste14